jgi:DNA-binding PadR family transcriptional regulator
MSDIQLTPTSYIVLGLLRMAGPSTPYELKQAVSMSVGRIWSVPHSQLYREPDRLTRAGYVTVERERSGRRRKVYSLTEQGQEALAEWLGETTQELPELRDIATLKLFFGADASPLADVQAEAHRKRLAEYESYLEALGPWDPSKGPRAPWVGLEAGIRYEQQWIDYWETQR